MATPLFAVLLELLLAVLLRLLRERGEAPDPDDVLDAVLDELRRRPA